MAARESKAARIARTGRIADTLARLYSDARVTLDFKTPWQLLAATILSAQCTDERVNIVTPALFRKYPDAEATAAADVGELERIIATTGFFRQKARSLESAATEIVERHRGEVPTAMEELVKLRGVGRKTANVVLGHAYGMPGIAVDTHVTRVSRRLGLTRETDPDKIEAALCGLLPSERWTAFSMRLILHGRRVCVARKPRCAECALLTDCSRIGVRGPIGQITAN
jgi:endonuclease-3